MCCSLVKYFLFAFNFLFWAAGLAILGVGVWMYLDEGAKDVFEVLGESALASAPIALMVAGGLMVLFGFVGCYGAIKESTCLLGIYVFLLVVVLGLEVGVAVWIFNDYGSVTNFVNKSLEKNTLEDSDNFFVNTQQEYQCCGYSDGCHSWVNDTYGCNCTETTSNCAPIEAAPVTEGQNCTFSTYEFYYNQTCTDVLSDAIDDNIVILGGVTLGIGLAEIFGIIITLGLCCHINNEKNKSHPA